MIGGHWDAVWAAWAVLVAASFALIEGRAIGTHHYDRTLSERLRAWLGLGPRRPWRHVAAWLFLTALGAFCTWFAAHIVGGWGA